MRRRGWRSAVVLVLLGLALATCWGLTLTDSGLGPPPIGAPGPSDVTTAANGALVRAARPAEHETFLRAVDSLWIPFAAQADTLTALERVVLDDVAEVLAVNPSLRLRLWASAPDAPDRDAAARPTGADTELAGRRRDVVREYLLASGVEGAQLAEQAEDPAAFPAEVQVQRTGGAFLFVAEDAGTLYIPVEQARVRVRARPGSEVFLLPRSIAERDTTLACAPPLVARFEVVGADSVVERPYPPRPVVAVARDAAGVIVTRNHDVDPSGDPDLVDLLAALPDPRCRR